MGQICDTSWNPRYPYGWTSSSASSVWLTSFVIQACSWVLSSCPKTAQFARKGRYLVSLEFANPLSKAYFHCQTICVECSSLPNDPVPTQWRTENPPVKVPNSCWREMEDNIQNAPFVSTFLATTTKLQSEGDFPFCIRILFRHQLDANA